MIRSRTIAITLLAGLGFSLAAHASEDRRVRLLAATCITCHGPAGVSLGAIPSLAGQDASYLRDAMMEQRKGERETTVMRKYMMGFTPEEIAQLADYFSKLQ